MESLVTGRVCALILAAGANTRINSIVAPFGKPLILMNGRPLIRHAIDHAERDWNASIISVVVAPENARAIISLCRPDYNYVVQPSPLGVVDAISRGLRFSDGEWTLILCADNTFTLGNTPITLPPMSAVFGSRVLPDEESKRFTRFKKRKPIDVTSFQDNAPIFLTQGVHVLEASEDVAKDAEGVWIGPLLLKTQSVIDALAYGPMTIVELIKFATKDGLMLNPIEMLCQDLGMPEELQA